MKLLRFLITHSMALALGVMLGFYLLPILTEPEGPSVSEVTYSSQQALYKTRFHKEVAGSDLLHWGEGDVSISKASISLMGSLAPGPDYFLYLTKNLVDSRESFLEIKADSLKVGPIRTFDNFIVPLDESVDLEQYAAVVVWCETFSQFITSASYR
jgi:hypothetical protein